jgi:glycosyltransferase involved in cell wall biosynthesis
MPAVVRVITRLNIGGPSIQAATLSSRLRAHGFETHLVHGRLGEGEGDMSYLLPPDVAHTYLPELQRPIDPSTDLAAARSIYRVLQRERPAIVHTHLAKAGAAGRLAAIAYNRTVGRSNPAKIVHTYHGHVLEGYFHPLKSGIFIRAERALARATDRLIAISPRILHELLGEYRIGNETQYAVVRLGFNLQPFAAVTAHDRETARAALGIAADAHVMTTVGRLTAIKQHELFVDAAKTLAARDRSAVFLIAGDGERRAELEADVRAAGLTDRVRFLGWRRDLPALYAATDVFVLTSRNEGTPVALIEAMASGVPGVSTNVGGVRDVIANQEMGVLVPVDQPEGLAPAVERLFADPAARAAMGGRGRAHVLACFTDDRLVADIASLYHSLLS